MPNFDVVGVGLNATDTLILVPHFPPYAGKVRYRDEMISTGGEVATALAACAALGLRTKYVGSVGDDERGRIQVESLRQAGIDINDLLYRVDCANQSACIIIDQSTGERTVFARRPDCLNILPEEIRSEHITCARLLHIDGHNTEAVARAASIARSHGIPVTADVDTVYHGFERVLPNIDYLIASSDFPPAWTGRTDPFEALETIQREYGMKVVGMTLGAHGALARASNGFVYSPGFVVDCLDTTGAGDVFHGAFCFGVLQSWPLLQILEFSNAMAALNCTAYGARGGIRSHAEVKALIAAAPRRVSVNFSRDQEPGQVHTHP